MINNLDNNVIKRIKLQTFNITYCLIGFLLALLGYLLDSIINYLTFTASSFLLAISILYIYKNSKEHISTLTLTPEKLILQYKKFNKVCKEINIDIKDINEVSINIIKCTSKSHIVNTFPYSIEFCFKSNNNHKLFYLQKGDYNIVFIIYKNLKNIINNITIKASGVHSNVIQADIDNYLKCGKRLSTFTRFMLTQNKRGKIEIFIGITILFLFYIILVCSLINYSFIK